MDRICNSFASMNDAQPILLPTDELELKTMMRGQPGEDQYVTVTAPTNLPAGYELTVDVMDGSFWTVQVVRTTVLLSH